MPPPSTHLQLRYLWNYIIFKGVHIWNFLCNNLLIQNCEVLELWFFFI